MDGLQWLICTVTQWGVTELVKKNFNPQTVLWISVILGTVANVAYTQVTGHALAIPQVTASVSGAVALDKAIQYLPGLIDLLHGRIKP